ncbi:MAG: hypothetical protein JXR73_18635 [Candidatus Omnitrophica bacterium]|nr:hypothetical protein [Candidatus Omnitrophota bacterium]
MRKKPRRHALAAQQAGPHAPMYRRNFGCMSFLGSMFVVFIVLLAIVFSVRTNGPNLTEPERRIQEIAQQKREIDARLQREIPEFVRLLYEQAADIKKELNSATEASKKSYLMDELEDIARTFVFLDKEESEYKDLLSELSSIERTLIRLKESEKLFGSEYEDFMEQSRNAMTKAKAKLTVKINLDMDKSVSLNEIQIQEKMDELLQ